MEDDDDAQDGSLGVTDGGGTVFNRPFLAGARKQEGTIGQRDHPFFQQDPAHQVLRGDTRFFIDDLKHGRERLMQRFNWPGNIRQLENMIRSYILIGSEEAIAADLAPTSSTDVTPEIDLAHPISLKEITKAATKSLERQIILKVLQANGWSRQKTAKWLNISSHAPAGVTWCKVGSSVLG